jgi:hypothetical protein
LSLTDRRETVATNRTDETIYFISPAVKSPWVTRDPALWALGRSEECPYTAKVAALPQHTGAAQLNSPENSGDGGIWAGYASSRTASKHGNL